MFESLSDKSIKVVFIVYKRLLGSSACWKVIVWMGIGKKRQVTPRIQHSFKSETVSLLSNRRKNEKNKRRTMAKRKARSQKDTERVLALNTNKTDVKIIDDRMAMQPICRKDLLREKNWRNSIFSM